MAIHIITITHPDPGTIKKMRNAIEEFYGSNIWILKEDWDWGVRWDRSGFLTFHEATLKMFVATPEADHRQGIKWV